MADEIRPKGRKQPAEQQEAAQVQQSAEMEIDLVELLYSLLDHIKYIIIAAVLGAVIAAVYTTNYVTPIYQATSKIYMVNSKDSVINLSDLQLGSYLTNDYLEVFKTWEVHEQVLTSLGINYSYGKMQGMLSVSNPSNTRILNISIQSADPKEAALFANEYAKVAQQYIAKTMATEMPNILSEALEPSSPISPNKTRNIMMGFLIGALLVAGIVVLRFILDDKIKSPDDLRKHAGLATLAVIHQINESSQEKTRRSA